jgi:broad specificity phosphatase PhoE
MDRISQFLNNLPAGDGQVAIVTHKMTIHAFYALATGWTADAKPQERLRFPKMHRFFYDGGLTVSKLNESL